MKKIYLSVTRKAEVPLLLCIRSLPGRLLFLHLSFESCEITLEGIRQRLCPDFPDILAARARFVFDGLFPIMIANHLLALLFRISLSFHAEQEVIPVFTAAPHLAVSIDVNPLATKGLTKECVVECGAAVHRIWIQGLGGDRRRRAIRVGWLF